MYAERLYYLTQDLENATHLDQVDTAIQCGLQWIQIRSKTKDRHDLIRTAREAVKRTSGTGSRILINDEVRAVVESGAHGVHLGKLDMPVKEARAILGATKIIGATANSEEDILRLWKDGADYIGLGPFRHTTTKEGLSPILGLAGIRRIAAECAHAGLKIPVFAIGGITAEDVAPLLQTGVYGIAVASAINRAGDRMEAIRDLQEAIKSQERASRNLMEPYQTLTN